MSEIELLMDVPTRVHTLRNGLTLVVREDRRDPVVAIVTRVAAGYFDETDDQAGISHVLEHMFFKGTPRRGPGEIGQATKEAGGYLNASTAYHRTLYHTVLPSESLETGIELQSDALLHARIDEGELRRELAVIIEEAKRKRDNPNAVATESLFALMHDHHRIRRWRIGSEDRLAAFTRDDVRGFHDQHYRGPNVVLTVVGDVETSHVVDLVEAHYDALAGSPVTRDRGPDEPADPSFRYRAMRGDVSNAYIEWGWRTPSLHHDDTPALDVLAMVLGQGRASRFYRAIRDAGLAHVVDASNYTPEDIGVFNVSLETAPGLVMPALHACLDVLRDAAVSVQDDELERVRTLLRARVLRRMETVEGQANLLADWQSLGHWRMVAPWFQAMLDVDAAALRDVAGRYLVPEHAALLVYAPHDAALKEDADEARTALFDHAPGRGRGAAQSGDAGDGAAAVAALPAAVVDTAGAMFEADDDGVRFYRGSNGARIVVLPRPGTGLVSLAMAAPGGSCAEQEARAGITGLVGRTALRGTRHLTAAQLAERTERLGGGIGANVGADIVAWTLSVPARHAAEGIGLLAEAALHPTFPEDELERERAHTLAHIAQLRDDMYRYPMRLCLAAAFPRHPYGFSVEAQEQAVGRLRREDLVGWHAELMSAANVSLFIVGDVRPDAVAGLGAAMLGEARAAVQERACGVPAVWPASPVRAVVERSRAQTALALAFPGPRRGAVDADALSLLANAIGGLGGRLFEELRSRQSLAYSVSAAPLARQHGGAFHAYIAMAPEREDEARDGLMRELVRLRTEAISQTELDRARRHMIGMRRIRRQTNNAQLVDLLAALLIGRGLVELRDYEARLGRFDTEALRGAAERWLDPERVVEGTVRGQARDAAE